MKYLLLFAFFGVLWWVWSKRNASADDAPTTPSAQPPEKMVTCAHCGVYFPESEGLLEQGMAYCCEAHRVAGPKRGR